MSHPSLTSLRSRIAKSLGKLDRGPRRRIPPRLRRMIGDYAAARVAQGAPRRVVCAELGVSDPTLVRILDERPAPLRRVRVKADAVTAAGTGAALVVRGPGGVVIEGLDVDGVVALMRALS